ncbi:DMT family transporter [Sphingopyxis sp. EG6]|uniref:DMT family transporter n=1 Tax=Sphingopyxis sp. EG6 TaxID=1874061 RepID=UPI000DC63A5B|nr:multidrug efflux SMR transporter [Sphingopyxis sp. EG6]MEA3264723.1 multidrug efflux SMR transporter [Pseudomonadota bacterium]BBB08520.1 cation/cationic drug transporter [Sphingopyxis sp. EG6]
MGWLFLVLASVFEVGFTTTLRFTDNFKNIPAVAAFVVCVCLSLVFLELANRSIPLGTAYAIWTGVGAAGTVVIGMLWFNEPATAVRGLLILGIIACAIGLKFTAGAAAA